MWATESEFLLSEPFTRSQENHMVSATGLEDLKLNCYVPLHPTPPALH